VAWVSGRDMAASAHGASSANSNRARRLTSPMSHRCRSKRSHSRSVRTCSGQSHIRR
jgi:hypothetical protein